MACTLDKSPALAQFKVSLWPLALAAKTSVYPALAPTIQEDDWVSSEKKTKMRMAVGLLVAQALGVWTLLLLESDLPVLRSLNMLGRLLVLVVAHRCCSTILAASIVFAMLDGCLSRIHHFSTTLVTLTTITTKTNKKRKKENMFMTTLDFDDAHETHIFMTFLPYLYDFLSISFVCLFILTMFIHLFYYDTPKYCYQEHLNII